MESTRQALGLPVECCHAWCDFTIVLAWLDGSPKRYRSYVGNRLSKINEVLPPGCWNHVPTQENPADCASRGVSPGELVNLRLWWDGPPWLLMDPVQVPPQPGQKELAEVSSLEERKQVVVGVVTTPPALWLEGRYRDYRKLLRVTARVIRFWNLFKSKLHTHHITSDYTQHLSAEVNSAELGSHNSGLFLLNSKLLLIHLPHHCLITARLLGFTHSWERMGCYMWVGDFHCHCYLQVKPTLLFWLHQIICVLYCFNVNT